MKKNYLLLSFVIVGLLTVLNTTQVKSNKDFARPGNCGDPTTNSTCVNGGCHGGTNQPATAQNLLLRIGLDTLSLTDTLNANFRYVAGQTYYINFNIKASAFAYGFQTIALDGSNNNAGTFAVTSPHTKLVAGYMTHLIATQGYNSWLFKWTAPTTNVGPVTFYYAFNPADSVDFGGYLNAVPSSNIFVGSTTIQYGNGLGINEINSNISDLEVYPNPVNGAFNLTFNLIKSGNVSASIYSIDGKLCTQLVNENMANGAFSRNYDIAALPAGIYLVKLNMNGAEVTKKIVKE